MRLFATLRLLAAGALLLTITSVFPPNALGEPLPQNAQSSLEEILNHDHFQPRGHRPSSWEQIKRLLQQQAVLWLKRLWDSLPFDRMQLNPNSLLAKALDILGKFFHLVFSAVAAFFALLLEYGLYCLVLLAFAVAVYYLWRLFSATRLNAAQAAASQSADTALPTFAEIGKMGFGKHSLIALRLVLRDELETRHNLRSALTDRELARQLMPAETGLAFKNVAQLFEEVIYAARPLAQESWERVLADASSVFLPPSETSTQ